MSEPGSGDGTGKGKGSSSEPSRLEPRQQNAGEGCGQSRVECVAPSPEKGLHHVKGSTLAMGLGTAKMLLL